MKNFLNKFRNLKVASAILAVVIAASFAYFYKGVFVAATVNGSPISRWSVVSMLEKQAGKTALDKLITEKLINSEIQKRGIAVSDDEVNAVLKGLEDRLKSQGQTLDQALLENNMTKEDLIAQIKTQKSVEKMLADKTSVTETDMEKFIAENKLTPPPGQEEAFKDEVRNQLKQQKMAEAADSLIQNLRQQASINRFVNY